MLDRLVIVSGPTQPDSPPPEVPEEFASAYRAAYEQALAAQTVGAHRDDTDHAGEGVEHDVEEAELPVRRGPIRVGTHRTEEEYEDEAPTWFERVRDSHWFVPLLLALLALLLILGAYAAGLLFAGQVAGDEGPGR